MRLEFGTPVCCYSGDFGRLSHVIFDPQTLRVTHLVVKPHQLEPARLAPIRTAIVDEGGIMLTCSLEEALRLPFAGSLDRVHPGEETHHAVADDESGLASLVASAVTSSAIGPRVGRDPRQSPANGHTLSREAATHTVPTTAGDGGTDLVRQEIHDEMGRLLHHPIGEAKRLEHVAKDGESPATPIVLVTGILVGLAAVFAIFLSGAMLAYYLAA